jgi:hypothetical protein
MKRVAVAAAVVGAAVLATGASPARATNECRGLQVCVRVAGPWVVVPPAPRAQRPRVEFQLSCPRRFVVGGLDAELSDRAIDVRFYGKLGSPVNPGITTTRAAVFVASYAGTGGRAVTFRPHIGCIPASGGGGGPVPYRIAETAAAAPFPPGEPTTRRVRTVRPRAGATQTAALGCAAGERLVGGWHAVGFETTSAPSAGLVSAIAATRVVRANRVTVSIRSSLALRGVRAVVQVGAVCAGGS